MGKPRKKTRGHKNACEGKQVFETLEAAEKAAYRPRRMYDFMQAYKCRKCKKFHYGHVPSKKKITDF